jgi:hypothetical protein
MEWLVVGGQWLVTKTLTPTANDESLSTTAFLLTTNH